MIQLITQAHYADYSDTLAAMHQLRHKVFKLRLDWDVQCSGDMEIDEFDSLHPAHLVHISALGTVQGCVRLLPTLGPTMLRDVFSILMDSEPVPASPLVFESSRFAIDPACSGDKARHGLAKATYELFAGMVEFGMRHHLTDIVTVTDARMERVLRLAGWPLRRIGKPCRIGNTEALAGYLEVSDTALATLRANGEITTSILHVPTVKAVA